MAQAHAHIVARNALVQYPSRVLPALVAHVLRALVLLIPLGDFEPPWFTTTLILAPVLFRLPPLTPLTQWRPCLLRLLIRIVAGLDLVLATVILVFWWRMDRIDTLGFASLFVSVCALSLFALYLAILVSEFSTPIALLALTTIPCTVVFAISLARGVDVHGPRPSNAPAYCFALSLAFLAFALGKLWLALRRHRRAPSAA